jgi:hypothetical protein
MLKFKKLNQFKDIKRLLIILYLFISSEIVWGQFSVKVLDENFNSNAQRWETRKDSSSEMQIAEGKYLLKNKTDGVALSSSIDVPHLQSENFRLTASITMIKGIENNGFGILWGATDLNNDFEFVVSSNGFFKVIKWEKGIKEDMIGWTYQTAINKWNLARNELKIECTNSIIRFYINGTYVAATKYYKPFGQKVGFVLNETMEVAIDGIIAENFTANINENITTGIPSIQISKVELLGVENFNVLKVGEKAHLNIELSNNGNIIGNDLILSVLTQDTINGLLYNQFSMIDKIEASGSKQITIPVEADETVSERNINLKLELLTIAKKSIDTDNLFIDIKKPASYYNSEGYDNNTNQVESPNTNPNDEIRDCTSTCIGTGVATLITALIMAIFE